VDNGLQRTSHVALRECDAAARAVEPAFRVEIVSGKSKSHVVVPPATGRTIQNLVRILLHFQGSIRPRSETHPVRRTAGALAMTLALRRTLVA
jgi:hypothetical protein